MRHTSQCAVSSQPPTIISPIYVFSMGGLDQSGPIFASPLHRQSPLSREGCVHTPAINEGCTRSLRISHTSRRTSLQPVPKAQVPCTPYRPPNRTGVIPVPALALPPRPGPRRAQRVCRFAAALQSAPTNALPQHGQHLLSEGTVYNYMYFGCLNRVYREGACVHSLTCPSTDTATTSSLRNASFRLRNVRIVLRNVSFRRAAASLGVQARLERVEQAQHTLHAPSL
jgi:hypothetical protein